MADGRVDFYQREDSLWDWRLVGGNGEQMCESNQGYTEQNDAMEGFKRCATLIAELVARGALS